MMTLVSFLSRLVFIELALASTAMAQAKDLPAPWSHFFGAALGLGDGRLQTAIGVR